MTAPFVPADPSVRGGALSSYARLPALEVPPSTTSTLIAHSQLRRAIRRRGVDPTAGDVRAWPDGTLLYVVDPSEGAASTPSLVRESGGRSEQIDGVPIFGLRGVSPARAGAGAAWICDSESRLVGSWRVGSERPRWYRVRDRPSSVMEAEDGSLLVQSTVPSSFRQYDLRDGALVERRAWVLPGNAELVLSDNYISPATTTRPPHPIRRA